MKILLRLPMTEEEKKAKGKEEEEVPEGFIDAVNEFYESSDIIFKCFDDIYSSYLRGGDIREDLKGFINVKSNVFRLISEILRRGEIGEKLENKGITKEKRDKTLTPHHLGNKFNSSFSSSSLTFFGTSDISSLSPYSTL